MKNKYIKRVFQKSTVEIKIRVMSGLESALRQAERPEQNRT